MKPEPEPLRDGRYYRRVWIAATATAAAIFLVPFAAFCVFADLESPTLRQIVFWGLPCAVLGLVLAAIAARYAVNFLRITTEQLTKAHELALVRERERDLAQQELVRKLMEERELAREKMQFESQLSEYEKYAALAQLALGAAHEINNPLLGILSHLELELREAADREERDEIEQCIEGTKRISSTIRSLLNYTRPGPLVLSKVNVERMVDETFEFLRHQPLFRGISLEKQFPRDLPEISADANQLSQIVMNLLLNSGQATSEGGKITVAAEKVKFEDMVEIRVIDTGTGIPADILPHVLEPFFTTKPGKGTGLGLSISQAYVRSHGGDLRIESLPMRGTTVRITLPIRQEGRVVEQPDEVVV